MIMIDQLRGCMEQEFYSIKEVAKVLGVGVVTIRRAIKQKLLPFIRIGVGKRSPYRISKKVFDEMHAKFLREMER